MAALQGDVEVHNDLAAPRALTQDGALTGRSGSGLEPCAAIEADFELQPGEMLQGVSCSAKAQHAPTRLR